MKGKKVLLLVESPKHGLDRAIPVPKKPTRKYVGMEIISFPDFETLGRVITGARLELLSVIRSKKPKSIQELARLVKRDFKNVHGDVKLLAEFGLIELQDSPRNGTAPVSKYDELVLAA